MNGCVTPYFAREHLCGHLTPYWFPVVPHVVEAVLQILALGHFRGVGKISLEPTKVPIKGVESSFERRLWCCKMAQVPFTDQVCPIRSYLEGSMGKDRIQ